MITIREIKNRPISFGKTTGFCRLLVEIRMRNGRRESHRDTRYCALECTLSTTYCQNFFRNCSPFVFTIEFPSLFDDNWSYVIRRIISSWRQKSEHNSWYDTPREEVRPRDVLRYIRYIPSWTRILSQRSPSICSSYDDRDRTRSSSLLWKVTRSTTLWTGSYAEGDG